MPFGVRVLLGVVVFPVGGSLDFLVILCGVTIALLIMIISLCETHEKESIQGV